MPVLIGQPAPDFKTMALVNGKFKEVALTEFRGKKHIVIFFYPLTRSRMFDIQDALAVKRENDMTARPDTQETEESSSNLWKGLPKVMRWVLVILAVILALELMFVFYTSTCFLR